MNLSTNQKRRLPVWGKVIIATALIGIVLAAAGLTAARLWYDRNLKAVSADTTAVRVEIPSGTLPNQIADLLYEKGLIRSTLAFRTYVRGKEYEDSLKAGVYELKKSMSVQDIVSILVGGDEASDLFTIPPGVRLDQIKERFIKNGFDSKEVDAAFNPDLYREHPALVAKPRGASLEGYLYPESFKITSATTVREIVEQSLDQMADRLTPERIEAFARQGLSPHEAIILASIIEKEVISAEDRRVVAQIFIDRLKEGATLGSDVTYEYAAALTGEVASPELDSPYNTRMYPGLPPGPISNVDESALDAVANPSDTNYYFFISGDDGKTYYATTNEEHEQNIKDHCQLKCGN